MKTIISLLLAAVALTLSACGGGGDGVGGGGGGTVLIQTSAGSFETPVQLATYSYSAIPGFSVAVHYLYPIDIDGDGIDELLVAGFETQPNTPAKYKNTKISLFGWRNGKFEDITSQWLPNNADKSKVWAILQLVISITTAVLTYF